METNNALIQNLKDAGCPQEVIEEFTNSAGYNDYKKKQQILSKQRRALLIDIHESQNKLDCLDYLICSLRTGYEFKL